VFYSPESRPGRDHFVRLCFFKKDKTLKAAIDILNDLHLVDGAK
jgi:aspartate/methionine/tyrosine aminotransferase